MHKQEGYWDACDPTLFSIRLKTCSLWLSAHSNLIAVVGHWRDVEENLGYEKSDGITERSYRHARPSPVSSPVSTSKQSRMAHEKKDIPTDICPVNGVH